MKALLILFVLSFHALGEDVRCPETIPVQQKLASPVAGWQPGSTGIPTQLAGVTIFEGKPQQGASLVYDQKKTLVKEWIATWTLAAGQEYWLSCSYQGTSITLDRRLPAAASRCTVTYEKDVQVVGLPAIKSMVCR